jgi:hypothetical protein
LLPGAPWTGEDALRWGVTVGAGAVVVVVAWWYTAGRATLAGQLGFASVGVLGLAVSFYGNAAWMLRGRRTAGLRMAYLLGQPPGLHGTDVVSRPHAHQLVAGSGQRWYHRADCPLAAGRQWLATTRAAAEQDGRAPCGICQP